MNAAKMKAAVAGVRAAFGPPGDYGYETKEGKALYELYKAGAEIQFDRVVDLEQCRHVAQDALPHPGAPSNGRA